LDDYDSIAPPPPEPSSISGPDTCCQNEICTYSADLPVECTAQWFADGLLQGSDSSSVEISWETAGEHQLILNSFCDGASTPLDTLDIWTNPLPEIPSPINGANQLCINSTETYTTLVGENENCHWEINSVPQPDTTNSIEINWTETGISLLEVSAVNQCGQGDPQSLEVEVLEPPIVNLGIDTTIFQGETLILNAQNPGSNYIWNTGDTTQTIEVTEADTYWVEVSNICSSASDTIIVDVIVDISETFLTQPLIQIRENKLFVKLNEEIIIQIQSFDSNGKLQSTSQNQDWIRIEKAGFYIIIIETDRRKINLKVFRK